MSEKDPMNARVTDDTTPVDRQMAFQTHHGARESSACEEDSSCVRSGYLKYITRVINNNSEGRTDETRNIFLRLHPFHHAPCTVCCKVITRTDR